MTDRVEGEARRLIDADALLYAAVAVYADCDWGRETFLERVEEICDETFGDAQVADKRQPKLKPKRGIMS